uniref:Ubiquitin carboxyl-terminal hydrolase 8 n=3 Tax=Cajanus cajan TaxID=3821 RepID=A0A151SQ53_CAJCA|nr:Ubiquitin carboxyl-terminal hydrolase 8 [Cajanus cajan]
MTRFGEKLRLRWLLPKPTRFLALLSLSTLHHLCKSLARFLLSQTLPFLAMDTLFSDYISDDFDSSSSRPHRRFLQDDERDFGHDRVYLLPHRWWSEAEGERGGEGVLYTVACNSDSDSEILLHLRKEEDRHKIRFSSRQYALVPEGIWLRALKR